MVRNYITSCAAAPLHTSQNKCSGTQNCSQHNHYKTYIITNTKVSQLLLKSIHNTNPHLKCIVRSYWTTPFYYLTWKLLIVVRVDNGTMLYSKYGLKGNNFSFSFEEIFHSIMLISQTPGTFVKIKWKFATFNERNGNM